MHSIWELGPPFIYGAFLIWRSARLIKAFIASQAQSPRLGPIFSSSGQIRSVYFVGVGWVLLIAYIVRYGQS